MNTRVYIQDEVAVVKPEQTALYASHKEELNDEIQKLIASGTSKVVLVRSIASRIVRMRNKSHPIFRQIGKHTE